MPLPGLRGPERRSMRSYLATSFASLAIRHFAILWAGSFLAFVAFFMSTVIQSIVAFELTGRNGAVGVVLLGQGLAMALFGPIGGAVADRLSKRLVTMLCQGVIGLVFFALGALVVADAISVPLLAAGSFVIGTAFAFMGPARQAWVVELVEPALRANAVALNQVAINASRVLAPALAGLLVAIALIGTAGAYFVMAASYVLVVLSLALLPPSRPASDGPSHSVFGDLVAGLVYVRSQPRLRAMMLLFFVMIVLGLASVAAVMPGHVEHALGRPVESYAHLQAISAVGGLLASMLVAPLAASRRALAIYAGAAALMGVGLILLGVVPVYLLAFVPMFLYGLGSGAFQTLNMAVIVVECEPSYYGRVSSLTMLAFAGFMLAGLPVGLLADAVGERATLVFLGVAVIGLVTLVAPVIARAPSAQVAGAAAIPAPAPSTGPAVGD